MELDFEKISFEIIGNVGEAKSLAMEAIQLAKNNEIDLAKEKIKEANSLLVVAENSHFEVIQKEAQGEQVPFKVLFMHAEDQMLSTQTTVDLAEQFIDVYKILNEK